MHDRDRAYVFLNVTNWVQAIASASDPEDVVMGDLPGMTLKANCVASDNSLRLSSKEEFSKLWVEVYFTEGPLLLGNGKPPERGMGLFDYGKAIERIPSGVGCYIGFGPEHYKEIWAQVRSGAFSQCAIGLELAPLDRSGAYPLWDVENNRRLFVLGATVRFTYGPNART